MENITDTKIKNDNVN